MSQRHIQQQCDLLNHPQVKKLILPYHNQVKNIAGKGFFQISNTNIPGEWCGHFPRQFVQNTVIMVWHGMVPRIMIWDPGCVSDLVSCQLHGHEEEGEGQWNDVKKFGDL